MTRSNSSCRLETDKTDGRPGDWTFVHQRKYHFLCEQSTNSDRFINLYVCRYVHLLYNYIEMLARSNLGNRYQIFSTLRSLLNKPACSLLLESGSLNYFWEKNTNLFFVFIFFMFWCYFLAFMAQYS